MAKEKPTINDDLVIIENALKASMPVNEYNLNELALERLRAVRQTLGEKGLAKRVKAMELTHEKASTESD